MRFFAPRVARRGRILRAMDLPAEHRGPAPGPAAVAPSAAPESIGAILERFVAGFNDNDLDAVMAFFAEDAVYAPGDGKEHRGKAAIRAAFRPQFEGAYGEMTFAVSDRLVDEAGRKAAIRWVCHHDLGRGQGGNALTRWVFRALYGARFGWHGMDVFHFDARGQIAGKFTYAHYHRPQIRRDLRRGG
jgi:uncharacterized protein (TIGR02246 family)